MEQLSNGSWKIEYRDTTGKDVVLIWPTLEVYYPLTNEAFLDALKFLKVESQYQHLTFADNVKRVIFPSYGSPWQGRTQPLEYARQVGATIIPLKKFRNHLYSLAPIT